MAGKFSIYKYVKLDGKGWRYGGCEEKGSEYSTQNSCGGQKAHRGLRCIRIKDD